MHTSIALALGARTPWRRIMIGVAALVFAATAFLSASPPQAQAFKPAAHLAILEAAVASLPAGSTIRRIMEEQRTVAAWAANGPDLGFLDLGAIFGRPLWGALYHGDLAEDYAQEQLRLALASRDDARIAWAAGWIAHRRADAAGHTLYVDPEADTIADLVEQAKRHNELEEWAEPYVWAELAGRPLESYTTQAFPLLFAPRPGAEVRDLMRRASESIFGDHPSDSDIAGWMTLFDLGLTAGIGYDYMDASVAATELAQGDRIARLRLAYETGVADVRAALVAIDPYPPDTRLSPFPDLEPSHPYYSALLDVHERGVLDGYSDGRLGADDPVLRQQFAKMAVAALGLPVSEADVCPFSDVTVSGAGALYPDNYVASAAAAGLLKGRSSTVFDPYAPITRAAAVTIAVRAAAPRDAMWTSEPPEDWIARFPTLDDPAHGPNLRVAEFNGLLQGIEPQGWDPWAPATRGELAKILRNLPGW
jgi:hypothetical protein